MIENIIKNKNHSFVMSGLNCEEIKKLCEHGWKCDNFKNLCNIQEHKGVKNKLIYYSEEGKEVDCHGNSIVMHIGKIFSKIKVKKGEENIIMPPGKFFFFTTQEIANIPLDLEGTLFMVPKFSNMGLLFFTLGHISPGFHGFLTGAILNMTDEDVIIPRHAGCLYFNLNRLEKPSKPHPKYHRDPQLDFDIIIKNQNWNRNPGFALTSSNFVTFSDLKFWIGITIAVTSILTAIILFTIGKLL